MINFRIRDKSLMGKNAGNWEGKTGAIVTRWKQLQRGCCKQVWWLVYES